MTKVPSESECSGGIFKANPENKDWKGNCYKYKVLTGLCIMVKNHHDKERNIFSWVYTDGCFAGGDAANYIDAPVGTHTDFEDITI